jgi:Dynamin family
MSECLTPELVLQRFDRLRATVVDVMRRAQQLTQELPAVRDVARDKLAMAIALVSHANLSLVVIGAEGAGKSTLIKGLVGQELSPIEAHEAGTVAPVYITYGPSIEPTFEIEFIDDRPPIHCTKQQFDGYIRQSTNPDNERQVLRAVVRVANPLLAHGLELVDMPGTGGYSAAVREQTQAFISSNVATVIGVASVRTYAPLIDLARNLAARDGKLTFQAIVSNRWTDTFIEKHSLAPLPDDVVVSILDEARRKGLDALKTRMHDLGLQETLTDNSLFVFSAELLAHRSGPTATAAHLREIDRFLERVACYVQENSLGFAIQMAAGEGEMALGTLSSYVNLRRDQLGRWLKGDRGLLKLFKENKLAALEGLWGKTYSEPHIQQLSTVAWNQFKESLADHRRRIVGMIDSLIRNLRDLPADTPRGVIRDKLARLRSDSMDRGACVNDALAGILSRLRDELTADANKVLARTLYKLSIFESHGALLVELTAEDVVRTGINVMDDGTGRLMAKVASSVVGGVVGTTGAVKAAALFFVPDPTGISQLVGLVFGAGAAWKAIDLTWRHCFGSETEAVIKELSKMREQFLDEKIREEDTLRQHVENEVRTIAKKVDGALMQRLNDIESLIENPVGEQPRIEAELGNLERTHADIKRLEDCLLTVRNEATQRAGTARAA